MIGLIEWEDVDWIVPFIAIVALFSITAYLVIHPETVKSLPLPKLDITPSKMLENYLEGNKPSANINYTNNKTQNESIFNTTNLIADQRRHHRGDYNEGN